MRRWGAGGTGSGRGQRGKPGKPGQSVRGGSRGDQLRVLEFGYSFPVHLSPPASPHGVGAPAGVSSDEPGLEVAGEYGPGPGDSANGEGATLAMRGRRRLGPSGGEN